MKNEIKNEKPQSRQQPEKRPYAQPMLEKHGNVESLTQQIQISPSGPIYS